MISGLSDETKALINSLDKKRKDLEDEAQVITDELTQSIDGKEPMGINTPLTDEEGFPRADIDLYRARDLRKRLNEIRYDHDMIMKEIEHQLFLQAEEGRNAELVERKKKKPKPKLDPVSGKWVVRNWDGTISGVENGHLRLFDDIGKESTVDSTPREDIVSTVDETCSEMNSLDVEEAIPFAKIENVMKNSPSELARLQVNDLLVKFGTVDHTNHREFVALSDIVSSAHANNLEIPLVILRKYDDGADKKISLTLKPEVWDGKGLVGCSFSRI